MILGKIPKPAVPFKWLPLTAGMLWSIVGISLCCLAVSWLRMPSQRHPMGMALSGIALAIIMYLVVFSKVAGKNLSRLARMSEKKCFFAFQSWKSYLNIIFMITLGSFLRHSSLPKSYLSLAYTAVGGGLFLASIDYYRWLWSSAKKDHNC